MASLRRFGADGMVNPFSSIMFRRCPPARFLSCLFLVQCGFALADNELFISEVKTNNVAGLHDEDGDYPDWIELKNPGSVGINLAGYQLMRDATTAWSFPAVTLPAQGYLVVFASGKNRQGANGPLHANFTLGEGDEVTLATPGGTPIDAISALPATEGDTSYGRSFPGAMSVLVAADATGRWGWELVGTPVASPFYAARGYADQRHAIGVNGLSFHQPAPGFALEMGTLQVMAFRGGRELGLELSRPGFSAVLGEFVVPTLNFATDSLWSLEFAGDQVFPLPAVPPVSAEALFYHAAGLWKVPTAGDWTLHVAGAGGEESEGCYQLKVGAKLFSSGLSGGIIIDAQAAANGDPEPPGIPPGPYMSGLHTVNCPVAGDYSVDLWWSQRFGDSHGVELSATEGRMEDLPDNFRLLGSTSLPVTHQTKALAPVGTNIAAGRPTNAGAFAWRTKFNAPPASQQLLRLHLRYADGFRAWIDGVLVAERNAPVGRPLATKMRTPDEMARWEEIDLPLRTSDLKEPLTDHALTVEVLRAQGQQSITYLQATLTSHEIPAHGPLAYFAEATPGGPNGKGLQGPAREPEVSISRGVFAGPIRVALSSTELGGRIFYTLDGTAATLLHGTEYVAPLAVNSTTILQACVRVPGRLPSHSILHSYVITANQGGQTGQGFPVNWGQVAADYDFNTEAVSAAGGTLAQSLASLPSISLVMPPGDLFGEMGLYQNANDHGKLSSFKVSAEWLYPKSKEAWRERAEMRIKGEGSRGDFPKHGFRLDFGNGKGDLRHPVMGGSGRERYNRLVLHGSFIDNVLSQGKEAQYIRDLWVRDTLRSMGHPAAHGEFFHIYLNGLYWGLYHAGERSDAQWCAEYFGGTADDWDVIDSGHIVDGVDDGWAAMIAKAQTQSPARADYDYITQRLDLSGFCDYMLVNLYAANSDWPSHNWYAARDKRTGVWRFLTWDAEASFGRPTTNLLPDAEVALGGDPGQLFSFLTKFSSFRDLFANRIRLHCFNGGVLTPAVAEATWMRRANEVSPAITAEYARWGDRNGIFGETLPLVKPADWQGELQRLRRDWFPKRTRTLLNQFRTIELFPSVLPPLITPSGRWLGTDGLVTIANTGSSATIYYTTDGRDPLGEDGQPAGFASAYTAPFPVVPPAVIKARGWLDEEASALTEVSFAAGTDFSGLKFSEISYKPSMAREEYVEVINRGTVRLNLGGVQLADALRFTFPSNVDLPPGQVVVIARSAVDFQAKFPGVAMAGVYAGALADEGERLSLLDPNGLMLDQIDYRPFEPWPSLLGTLHRHDYTHRGSLAWQDLTASPGDSQPGTLPTEPPFEIQLGKHDPLTQLLTLSYPASPAYRYHLQSSAQLSEAWGTLLTLPTPTAAGPQQIQVPVEHERHFFRILREP